MIEWKDVTSDYAGLFFRAEGGGSAPFGVLQSENAPNRYIDAIGNRYKGHGERWGDYILPSNDWSPYFLTGYDFGVLIAMRFHVSEKGGEVRPRNKAVRIWKRMK